MEPDYSTESEESRGFHEAADSDENFSGEYDSFPLRVLFSLISLGTDPC